MHAIVLDTETTDIEGEVIELAYKEISLSSNGIISRNPVRKLFGYDGEMSYGALATHHILPEEVKHLPRITESDIPLAEYWIGHNVDYDWKRLGSPPSVKRICTLAIARHLFPNESHTLGALLYMLSPNVPAYIRNELRNAHSALADVNFTIQILAAMGSYVSFTSVEHLYQISEEARVPKVMSFGKHKGAPLQHVDNGYRSWYKKQPDQDPYLLKAFEKYPYNPSFKPEAL